MTFAGSAGLCVHTHEQEDEMSETQSSTRITEVGRVMVPVTDQDRALEFYTGPLGLETRADTPFGDGMRWVEVAPAGAATAIALVPPRPGDPVGVETRISLTTPDIDGAHADLQARGVDVDAEVMRMGGPVPPMFWLRDPDGNQLMIVEPS
jgi:catechol 2,3-dioxygenase-like lactoylglutathione lyase family enzyme